MSSVRDYLTPEPLMFVTDLTRVGGGRSDARKTASSASGTTSATLNTAAAGAHVPSIYERVRGQKRKLEAERENCEELRQRIVRLCEERDLCTERYKIRRRKELEETISQLEEELRRVESGEKIKEFLESSAPYLKAFQRQQFCRPQIKQAAASELSNDSLPVTVAMVGGVPRQVPPLTPNNLPPPSVITTQQTATTQQQQPQIVRGTTSVVDDYAVAFEGAAPPYDIEARDTCKACGEPLQLHTGLSMLVCVKCGTAQPFLDATASLLSFSDDSYDYASFSYKRINHFTEWISAMQAKETTEISQTVLDAVMERLADERVKSTDEITVHRVRDILKKLKLRKYYEHTQLITCKITGRPPPRMTPTQEERIKLLFMAASTAFQQLCPPDRSNFLSYSFTLFKFSELLGYTDFLPNFALLRGPTKLRRQDEIYKALCEALDWEFIPSIAQ